MHMYRMYRTSRRGAAAMRPCALLLALLPCLYAQAQSPSERPARPGASPGSVATGGEQASDTPSARATELDAVVVTAQKRVERIQDVPIAISAFSAQALDELKIESGSELLRATPNVTFSKGNFASYNFSIRGIGTKALSVTTDPAVAISFNSTPLIRNRLFEQEYFDVDRIEVLRGPQGTLYGRNATGGVVNMIPNLPGDAFEADLKAELGNYDSRRISGMFNQPLTESLAFRVAGAWTRRDGYDHNTVTGNDVNDRDLWSARASLAFSPGDRFQASLVWERFEEDDRRARTGKQLCHRDPGPALVGDEATFGNYRAILSQGCAPGSLYEDGAFGTPNGNSLPQMLALSNVYLGWLPDLSDYLRAPLYTDATQMDQLDPFRGVTQSRDLRTIATEYDPRFKASNDVVQLNLSGELGAGLTLISQTAYSRDRYYSTQDYGRFPSAPIFADSDQALRLDGGPVHPLTPGGVYTDPQLGPSRGFLAVDLTRSWSRQWSQEFRVQSSFDGPFNFSVGANYLDFDIDEDYFVFNNVFSILAEGFFNFDRALFEYGAPPVQCPPGLSPDAPLLDQCVYIDPNPLDRIDGDGHNYFRSRNLARTRSWALFGESYWQATDTLKLTAGLRYTRDRKTTTPVPSQLLLMPGVVGGGLVNSGYPELPDVEQRWGEFTGRLVLDWKPDLAFTDDTLLYASYARGYKAGGTNSPGIGADPRYLSFQPRSQTFEPEFVNAFEIGAKNTLADGRLTLNASAFYYGYKGYQVSQIVDRSAFNENFDARSHGVELEAAWQPNASFRLDANLGYLKTRIARGERSIDVMDRTQGDPDWVVVRPWVQLASNCVAPREYVERVLAYVNDGGVLNYSQLSGFCNNRMGIWSNNFLPGSWYSELLGFSYDPEIDGPNGGQGFYADLGGKELPNAPRLTFNLGAQYTFGLGDWDLTLRGDYYRQSKSWSRVYNAVNDRLDAWDNVNLLVALYRPQSDLTLQLYVKNLFNDTPITDAFINSDDSGLTTNIFTLDPRIIGFSVRKGFF